MSPSSRIMGTVLFVLIFLLECGIGYYMSAVTGVIPVDANSRVASAYYVLFSRYPHLGAVGFIWNPLPSLLQLPIISFKNLFPALATFALSGVLSTAFFAGLIALLLFRNSVRFGISRSGSFMLSILFAVNPFVLLYGSNGMSEMIFASCIVTVVISWTRYLQNESTNQLIAIALCLAFAFLARYEAIPLAAAIAVCILLVIYQNNYFSKRRPTLQQFAKAESTFMVVFTPLAFVIGFWILINYIIMGDPLYFFHSQYSNQSQTGISDENSVLAALVGDPFGVIVFVLVRMLPFSIPVIVIVFWRIVRGTLWSRDMLMLFALLISTPALQMLLLYQGSSFGFLRFFFYPLPICAAWIPYEMYRQSFTPRLKTVALSSFLIALFLSAVLTGYWVQNSNLAPEESDYLKLQQSLVVENTRLSKEVAYYLDEHVPDHNLVLMDTFNAFEIVLNTSHPNRLVITSDYDFDEILVDPVENNLDYLLVPKPEGLALLNAVNIKYPDLFNRGAEWCVLEQNFHDKWKLYRVLKNNAAEANHE